MKNLSSFFLGPAIKRSRSMKYLISALSLFFSLSLFAQLPEDALRMSWTTPSGTARQQAIGGAMGSLGGEISAAYVNPAGIGMYKTSEFVLSPGFRFQKDFSNYRGTQTTSNSANNFNIGTSGFVFGLATKDPSNTGNLSLSVNRSANFASHIHYQGQNDYSSFSEQYVEEFANSGMSIDQALNSNSISYGTRMALYTYLVDTATVNGATNVIGQPEKVLSAHGILNQLNNSDIKGGITEIGISIAGSTHDKWFYGGTLGIPVVTYIRDLTFTESDASGVVNNDFATATYTEHYKATGAGVNLKLGVIYKPSQEWRLGAAVHTPTWYSFTDNLSATMSANTENYTTSPQPIEVSSTFFDQANNTSNGLRYDMFSPWRMLISGSYIFGGGVVDVKKQKGFITFDAEYVTTNSTRYATVDQSADPNYYKGVNDVIKHFYKGTFDVKLGGELKFNTIAARLGVSYFTNPYRDASLKANKLFLSGGLGYRNKGIFVDLTYIQGFTKDVNFPYRLADKANTYATLKENVGTVLLTVGFKFP